MTSHESKIACLLALALGNANLEEARTAAYMAITLAAKYGCRIDVPVRGVSSNPEPAARPAPPPPPAAAVPRPPAAAPRARRYARKGSAKSAKSATWTTINATWAAHCIDCSAPIAAGERCDWKRGEGCRCAGCSAEAAAAA